MSHKMFGIQPVFPAPLFKFPDCLKWHANCTTRGMTKFVKTFAFVVLFISAIGLPSQAYASLIHAYDLTSVTPYQDLVDSQNLSPRGGTAVVGVGYRMGQGPGTDGGGEGLN